MLIVKKVSDLQRHLRSQKNIGFVPTMGALHAGHLSLIAESNKRCGTTVCSIFVNPTQFNDPKDFEKYPVTISHDIELLSAVGCDVLFLPSVKEIYPHGTQLKKRYRFGHIAEVLEGEFRPGHFDGMAQVVERLLRIVKPHHLFMGQKDYQQQLIVGKLIGQLQMKTKLHCCAIVREKDGLAMSSRNVRLEAAARKVAPQLYKALQLLKKKSAGGSTESAIAAARKLLSLHNGIEVEYIALLNAQRLTPATQTQKKVALLAARIGGVRLIDNLVF